ncbi:MAG: hypothetical protein ACK5B6_01405, partial [Bacteroidia bacterium]
PGSRAMWLKSRALSPNRYRLETRLIPDELSGQGLNRKARSWRPNSGCIPHVFARSRNRIAHRRNIS